MHFQGWVDYNRVTFSLELLRMGSHIFGTGHHKIQVGTDLQMGRILLL